MSATTVTAAISHPVIGVLRPYALALVFPELETGFEEYETPTMRGLAMVTGTRLDLLVMDAHVPGRGDGGRFLAECQRAYDTVCVWEIMNPELAAMLARRGFRDATRYDDGKLVTGMRWDRERAP